MLQVNQIILQLRRDLGLGESPAEQLIQYRKALLSPSKKYEQSHVDDLRRTDSFQAWLSSEVSGLTLNSRSGFSWLSPVAPDVVDWLTSQFQAERKVIVVCALADTSAWIALSTNTAAHTVISQIILDVIDQCPSYLFDPSNLSILRRSLQVPKYRDSNPRLPCRLLSDVLNQCSDSELYIVLDRIDACDCKCLRRGMG